MSSYRTVLYWNDNKTSERELYLRSPFRPLAGEIMHIGDVSLKIQTVSITMEEDLHDPLWFCGCEWAAAVCDWTEDEIDTFFRSTADKLGLEANIYKMAHRKEQA